jgi:alkylation response protein AidB-like acyl-CoA dehydrogenase/DNA-binding transcriptional ArsR family regulator
LLGGIGLWGLTVPESHGGAGAGLVELARVVARLASISPTAAGMLSVHASIGAVAAVEAFGNASQRDRWLPKLARGEPLSIFGATEPDAGCDLGRVSARLERSPDRPGRLLLSGTKMFITNAAHGRLVKLLAKLDGEAAIVLAQLPESDTRSFQLEPSQIHPLKHARNATLVFDHFEVDEADLLASPSGDGMAIVWQGLNRGRVTLAAQAAGTQRIMLSHALSRARERETWGRPIATRQLVQGRLARIATGAIAAESLAAWAATAVDSGGGELEAITAKIVAGECVRESAIAALGVHAGRSFLIGHPLGDAIHDHLAVGIYEGESELLGLALFKGLAKRHPLAAARGSDVRRAAEWLAWRASRWAARPPQFGSVLDGGLRRHSLVARRLLDRTAVAIDRVIRRHGRKLAEEQLLVGELSRRVRELVAVMAVAHHVDRNPLGEHAVSGEHGACGEPRWRLLAAEAFCRTAVSRATGRRPSDADLAADARLGSAIVG